MAEKNIGKKEDTTLFKVIGAVLLGALVFFAAGYLIWSDTSDYEFVEQGNYWITTVELNGQPYNIPFYNRISETRDVETQEGFEDAILGMPKDGMIIISVDPNAPAYTGVAGSQISRITGDRFGILNIQTKGAYYTAPAHNTSQPIVDCEDAREDLIVIHMQVGSSNSISSEDSCITVTFEDQEGALKTTDRFVYELLKMV